MRALIGRILLWFIEPALACSAAVARRQTDTLVSEMHLHRTAVRALRDEVGSAVSSADIERAGQLATAESDLNRLRESLPGQPGLRPSEHPSGGSAP